ncbi:MAG: alpha/beta fold hydrolase, partial [Saprospiraceae bacterium]|nr:alpha/beta fold hydrolase [Saprospiraceae bacterium]
YRTYQTYERFQTNEDAPLGDFRASSYQQYQGEKLSRRFNAFSYYRLSQAMDSHHVGRGRGSVENALSRVRAKTLVLGIESDVLFPVQEQQYLASHIPGAHYEGIQSAYGHDGFLIETVLLTSILNKFLKTTPVDNKTGKTTPQLV